MSRTAVYEAAILADDIDGSFVLHVDKAQIAEVLKELGVSRAVHVAKLAAEMVKVINANAEGGSVGGGGSHPPNPSSTSSAPVMIDSMLVGSSSSSSSSSGPPQVPGGTTAVLREVSGVFGGTKKAATGGIFMSPILQSIIVLNRAIRTASLLLVRWWPGRPEGIRGGEA